MSRVYNFSPGPSMLPEPVLKRAASELLEYGSSGQSVMEMSHRSPEYDAIIVRCQQLLRETLSVPDNYKILFMQGGASLQFAAVPFNLMNGSGKADYVVSGQFAERAAAEAARFGDVKVVGNSKADGYSHIPELDPAAFTPDADYFHICQNNTIFGTRFPQLPDTKGVTLVADMSSCILSEPVDISRYGLIYAGAQKNMAPAGLCVVIVREDLIGKAREGTPTMMDYKTYADNDSMYNTPSTYPIYVMGLVLEWIQNDIGGLAEMKKINESKAAILYDFLDSSSLFRPTAKKEHRSMMNVTFITGDKDLDSAFCKEAQQAGLYNLKGHRVVGGMRASIYNAMPVEGVEKLVAFMKEFEAKHK